ncbi:MAG TPA: EAL domain-containing protein, partial [Bacillota bacterium]|nr:EAL domain-containing protein [Bacillota bacterium]
FTSSYIEINKILGEMKKAGIHIYIDDFGTGYSSLARERELNINSLKIDKFFVDDLMVLDPQREIIIDIISMAHKFDHKAIAEGVEHEKQRKNLIKCGCDRIQGFLISKPLDEDDAIKFLRKNTKRKKDSTKKGEQM